jgi:hypothetical protein
MDGEPLDLDALLGPRLEVTREQMEQFRSREEFIALGVDLLREVSKISTVLASVYPTDENGRPRRWTRNEAILGGLMVRLSKLQRGVLGATCENHLEVTTIIMRCLVETAINLEYLARLGSDDLYDAYVEYSLREEKRLLKLINENVAERGQEIPIETRMKASVMHWFDRSGVDPGRVDAENYRPWAGSIANKARQLDAQSLYKLAFSLQSHSVHGNWQDLLLYHLESHDDGFSPMLDWHQASAELVFAATIVCANACGWYLTKCLPECPERDEIEDLLAHYRDQSLEATEVYGQFDDAGFTPLPTDARDEPIT